MRLGISRHALGGLDAKKGKGILALHQRPVAAAADAFGKQLELGIEPDDDAPFKQQGAGGRIDEGTPARGNHLARLIDQAGNHTPLAIPEMRFAITLENLCDAESCGRLDLVIGVGEGKSQPPRQRPPDRRFARAHQPDENDRPFVAQRRNLHDRGYTERARVGQKAAMPKYDFGPTRRRRSPVSVILPLVLVLIVALLVYAWAKNTEVEPTNMEQDVTNALAK